MNVYSYISLVLISVKFPEGECREVIWEQESSGEPNHHAKF